jgi:hypothetical protein
MNIRTKRASIAIGTAVMLTGCTARIQQQVDSDANRVTPGFLQSHGFRPSNESPDIFILRNVRLADAARDLGFSVGNLHPTPSQPDHSDKRIVKIRNLWFVVESEMRDAKGMIISGSLVQSHALCTISVGLKQVETSKEKHKD